MVMDHMHTLVDMDVRIQSPIVILTQPHMQSTQSNLLTDV